MIIADDRLNGTESMPECSKQELKKNASISNRLISIASEIFVIVWVGASALWSKPYFADYYQKQANSHYDDLSQWFQIGPVFLVALLLSIHSFRHKKIFVGVLTTIIAIWSYYWAFVVRFSCFHCTYGG